MARPHASFPQTVDKVNSEKRRRESVRGAAYPVGDRVQVRRAPSAILPLTLGPPPRVEPDGPGLTEAAGERPPRRGRRRAGGRVRGGDGGQVGQEQEGEGGQEEEQQECGEIGRCHCNGEGDTPGQPGEPSSSEQRPAGGGDGMKKRKGHRRQPVRSLAVRVTHSEAAHYIHAAALTGRRSTFESRCAVASGFLHRLLLKPNNRNTNLGALKRGVF
ncbi:hypothetical protein EYF80_060420 [Liparis tanakae]|uniref:Uncharacterized protein n=1 Tax=Liparis tanakae TaxID=230148 RepID=A0A4Z2ELJ2_9TELE|nr:hypothetical protein EYF80_060420 [Liparis tanakae]